MPGGFSFDSFLRSEKSGVYQAAFFLLLGILLMTIEGFFVGDKEMVYIFGSSVLLLFILFNAVIGVVIEDFRKYVLRSTIAFILMSVMIMFFMPTLSHDLFTAEGASDP